MMVSTDCRVATYPENIKLILADPPYGMDVCLNGRRNVAKHHAPIAGDSSLSEAMDLLTQALEATWYRLDKSEAYVVLFCKAEPSYELATMNVLSKFKPKFMKRCTWVKQSNAYTADKEHGLGNLKLPANASESFIFCNVHGTKLPYRLDDVLYGKVNSNKSNVVSGTHPTPKPVDLLKQIIEATTRWGDMVVDMFAGNGNTLLAGKLLGREVFGCEINLEYVHEYNAHMNGILNSLWPLELRQRPFGLINMQVLTNHDEIPF